MQSLLRRTAVCLGALALCGTIFLASGARTPEATVDTDAAPHELLNATLWVQRSAEYRAICLQTFAWGKSLIDQGLKNDKWHAALEEKPGKSTKPPAIIVDVDETMLDNSFYEARLIRDEEEYSSKSWDPWCHEASAPPLPGALEFCRYAAEHGVTVFYVTNRKAHLTEATRKNLVARGFPMKSGVDTVMTRTDEKEKDKRRRAVAENYRILLLVGDNVGDFASTFGESDQALRTRLVDEYAPKWGSRWLILPNPCYGSWEGAILEGNYRVSRDEKLTKKRAALLFDSEPQAPKERF